MISSVNEREATVFPSRGYQFSFRVLSLGIPSSAPEVKRS
jgi:hypothetical protein